MSVTAPRPSVSRTTRPRAARAAAIVVALFLAGHGAVHGMGVALLWRLGEPGGLRYADAVPTPGSVGGYLVGLGWLVSGGLLIAAAALALARRPAWRLVALNGALLSAAVIGLNLAQAVAGMVADALVLLLIVGSWLLSRRATAAGA